MDTAKWQKKKLKHIALKEIHYQLVNTCLIISSEGWRYCLCWRYLGCRNRPSHCHLLGEGSYCKICQIGKIYHMDRMYNIRSIQETWKLYVELKKDLQEFSITTTHRNFWLEHYSRQYFNKKIKKYMFLKNYINKNYNNICYLDP